MSFYDAINLITEQESEHKRIDEILIDDTYIARGFIFSLEYKGKWYLLVNKSDFEKMLAMMHEEYRTSLVHMWLGIPVVEDFVKVREIMKGIFFRAIKA